MTKSAVPSGWIEIWGGNEVEYMLANCFAFSLSMIKSTASFPTNPLPGNPQISFGCWNFGNVEISTEIFSVEDRCFS